MIQFEGPPCQTVTLVHLSRATHVAPPVLGNWTGRKMLPRLLNDKINLRNNTKTFYDLRCSMRYRDVQGEGKEHPAQFLLFLFILWMDHRMVNMHWK